MGQAIGAPLVAAAKAVGGALLGGGAAASGGAAAGGGALATAAKVATIGAGIAGTAAALRRPQMPGLPAPLPTPDETEIESARRRRIAGKLRMSGVASTLLGGGAGGKLG